MDFGSHMERTQVQYQYRILMHPVLFLPFGISFLGHTEDRPPAVCLNKRHHCMSRDCLAHACRKNTTVKKQRTGRVQNTDEGARESICWAGPHFKIVSCRSMNATV
ncbi:hypothetical protein JTE90_024300 [Oedothorax gibbosus]|uniref:Uncharacterized protein n=1 Tax=Oedothorax gibbosus TaxID=931172 RepID=A0AAV6VXU1_9ARAC|nr:hypothetical protein JTE90_024300 [Oedothorax gibbosus]